MDILELAEPNITRIYTVLRYQTTQKSWHGKARPFHCLAYTVQGGSCHTISELDYRVESDTVLFIPKGVAYDVTTDGAPVESIVIHFDMEDMQTPEGAVYRPKNPQTILRLFEDLERHYFRKEPGGYARCFMLLYEVLAQMTEQHWANSSSEQLKQRLAPALALLKERVSDPTLCVEALARRTGFSRQHFRRLFIQAYGMPPSEYLCSLRISHAKDLLRDHGYTVSQIAERTGFSGIYYFSRLFKQLTGMTPSEYRWLH